MPPKYDNALAGNLIEAIGAFMLSFSQAYSARKQYEDEIGFRERQEARSERALQLQEEVARFNQEMARAQQAMAQRQQDYLEATGVIERKRQAKMDELAAGEAASRAGWEQLTRPLQIAQMNQGLAAGELDLAGKRISNREAEARLNALLNPPQPLSFEDQLRRAAILQEGGFTLDPRGQVIPDASLRGGGGGVGRYTSDESKDLGKAQAAYNKFVMNYVNENRSEFMRRIEKDGKIWNPYPWEGERTDEYKKVQEQAKLIYYQTLLALGWSQAEATKAARNITDQYVDTSAQLSLEGHNLDEVLPPPARQEQMAPAPGSVEDVIRMMRNDRKPDGTQYTEDEIRQLLQEEGLQYPEPQSAIPQGQELQYGYTFSPETTAEQMTGIPAGAEVPMSMTIKRERGPFQPVETEMDTFRSAPTESMAPIGGFRAETAAQRRERAGGGLRKLGSAGRWLGNQLFPSYDEEARFGDVREEESARMKYLREIGQLPKKDKKKKP